MQHNSLMQTISTLEAESVVLKAQVEKYKAENIALKLKVASFEEVKTMPIIIRTQETDVE